MVKGTLRGWLEGPELGVGVNIGSVGVKTGAVVGGITRLAPAWTVAVGVVNPPPGTPLEGGSAVGVSGTAGEPMMEGGSGVGLMDGNVKGALDKPSIIIPVGVGVSVTTLIGTPAKLIIMGAIVGVAVGVGVSNPIPIIIGAAAMPSIMGVSVGVAVGVGVSMPIAIIIGAAIGPPPKGMDTLTESDAEVAFDEVTVTELTFSPSTHPGGRGLGTFAEP
ncbi:MAG: hypothetical protein ACERKX_08105, partial [Anaerolineales bacterium]